MANPGELTIDVLQRADRVILKLGGDLDLNNSALLQRAIADAGVSPGGTLVLDIEKLDFLDSSGLRVLLGAAEDAHRQGRRFAVTQGSQQVQRLLDITGAGARLPSIATAEEVLA